MARNIQAKLSTSGPFPEDADGFEIPPYPRRPKKGTREATESMVQRIDVKIEQLKGLGLRAHPNMLEYRLKLLDQLHNNGPYRLETTSGMF